ncbi:MAG TPA: DNA polymerase IV [Bacillota bacterium]|nr:DNA polymerase IV [Bacillota bacterium]
MKSSRIILHSDLNAFYASVACMLDPSLKGKAVAVCGCANDRHGIVLAKSQLAKDAGIKTGMANWQAKRLCPEVILLPPNYNEFVKASKAVREIYGRFTERVEPYGMDECWLDVSKSCSSFEEGYEIAEKIRSLVKDEMGLTVSIGVSFNKVFAKLGSDLKKPDAVTVISYENFREKLWQLPASDLLYVGRSTTVKLAAIGIRTIGGLAQADPQKLRKLLGINGVQIWSFANGEDSASVQPSDFRREIKSIGHGITCVEDLQNSLEVWRVMLELSQDIGYKLRSHGLMACGVQITTRSNDLTFKQYQAPLAIPSQSIMEIACKARSLFQENYQWQLPIRSVTVRAINLIPREEPLQLDLLNDYKKHDRQMKLEETIDTLRQRFGKRSVISAALLGNLKMPLHTSSILLMPGMQEDP